jgi:serine/threonine protein kinase/Flp pilus assembly protein TadD
LASSSLTPGQSLGHFRITEEIGAGGMGVVYRAWDTRLERDVAVKVLKGENRSESERRRLRKEARVLSRLNHPNIESIYSIESDGDVDFLVFELLSGCTLADHIKGQPLDAGSIVGFGIQIAGAVSAAHQNGIIHRDLKPGNIFVTKECGLKVLDFGLARTTLLDGDESTRSLQAQGRLAGTLPYMAPEQIDPGLDDERSDIYSLGVVLYVMATGQRPFDNPAAVRLIDAILHQPPMAPTIRNPKISAELERIILKCLDKNPDARYQSAREIAIDLKRMLPPGTSDTSYGRAIPVLPRKPRQLAIVVAPLLLSVAAIAVWLEFGLHRPVRTVSVVVTEFENRTGNPAFDQTSRELISTALNESPQLLVFPSSRFPDVLKRMQKPENAVVDESVGREICSRESLQSVVSGSISKLGSSYLILARVLNCNGDRITSTEKTFSSPEELPAAIDQVAATIRRKLGESKATIRQDTQPLATVTSGSLEALKMYSSGKQQLYQGNYAEATSLFKEAVQMDGDFAMAHEYLAIAYEHLGDGDRAGEEYVRAEKLSSRVTEREREKILGDSALFQYDTARAIPHFQILTALSPEDPAVHLNLAECYRDEFRFDLAISEGAKAANLTPSPSPRNNLAIYYYLAGDSQRAIALAQQVLKESPGNAKALNLIGSYYLGIGKEREADGVWRQMLGIGGEAASLARDSMADAAQTRDNPQEAIIQLEYGVTADSEIDNAYDMSTKQILLADIYRASGDRSSLMRLLDKLHEPSSPELTFLLGRVYARSGSVSGAERQLQKLEEAVDQTPTVLSFSSMLGSELAVAQNNPSDAVEFATLAVQRLNSPLAIETLARAYEVAGNREEAARQYELVLARSNERQFDSADSPALHAVAASRYRLGVLYQSLGSDSLALQEFNSLLNYAGEGQGTGPMYDDARKRSAQIRFKTSAPEGQRQRRTEPTR